MMSRSLGEEVSSIHSSKKCDDGVEGVKNGPKISTVTNSVGRANQFE